MSSQQTLTIVSEEHKNILSFVRASLKDLVFRRVHRNLSRVNYGNLIEIREYYFDENNDQRYKSEIITSEDSRLASIEFTNQRLKDVQVHSTTNGKAGFRILTAGKAPRGESGQCLWLSSDNQVRIDFEEGTFVLTPMKSSLVPPAGQLICGILSEDGKTMDKWFACSEQFMRMWTLIMYDWHSSFKKSAKRPVRDEKELLQWCLQGNTLVINGLARFRLNHIAEAGNRDSAELKERNYRCDCPEPIARTNIHTYAAVVLMARFGITNLTGENVPRLYNADLTEESRPVAWSVPKNMYNNLKKCAQKWHSGAVWNPDKTEHQLRLPIRLTQKRRECGKPLIEVPRWQHTRPVPIYC